MKTLRPVIFSTALLVATPAIAQVVIANDTFESTVHPGGDRTTLTAGADGIRFYTRNATSGTFSASIINDSGVGGLGSLALNHTDTNTIAANGTSNSIIGLLPGSVSLSVPGDYVRLEFTFRYTNIGAATASATGFRFGIFDSNGSLVTGDNQSASDNDRGYYVQTGVGTLVPANNNTLFREDITATQPTPVAPVLGGVDRTNLVLPTGTNGKAFNDNNAHSVSLTITRVASSNVTLSLVYDSGTPITYTTTSSSGNIFTFDEIAFNSGFIGDGQTHVSFNVDNISIVAVPEPSTLGLLGLGSVGMLGLIRRRSR